MEERQRTRILEALAEELSERDGGTSVVTVTHIIARAGVSRRTFYELFVDREACLLAAFDLAVERAAARIVPSLDSESRWRDGIRVALAAFLAFSKRNPTLGGCAWSTRSARARRCCAAAPKCSGTVGGDRPRTPGSPAGRAPSNTLIAEGVVGAVCRSSTARLQVQGRTAADALFGPLMSIIVLPYLGASVARREFDRPAPKLLARA